MAFKKDFIWCAGGASAQQDGGYLDGGKGLSIWDPPFINGHIRNGEDNRVSCDHFHRWKDDLHLLKELGVNTYRFSVAPARIYPSDEHTVNEQGIRFYVDLVTELHKLGIQPMCTLYHWDMPMWLYKRGGWRSSLAVEWFERYTKTVVDAVSDKVKYWITFNEPQCFIGMGYGTGEHAPFEKASADDMKSISRNVMLAHGKAVKVIRENARSAPLVSYAPTAGGLKMPSFVDEENIAYERSFDCSGGAFDTAWWSDPIVLGKAPKGCDWLSAEDLKTIHQPLDFYAYNIYNSQYLDKREPMGAPRTTMGWTMTPECMYWSAKFFYRRYGLPIMITENGMANVDFVFSDGTVHDPQRSEYLRTHIKQLKRANDEGVPVIGYSCWSFLDNFEWAEGYAKRFGLVYVDYATQERIVKDSAYTYRDIIKTNGDKL